MTTHRNERRHFLCAGTQTLAMLVTLSFGHRSAAADGGATRILCSGPAGSIPDLIARVMGEQLPAMQTDEIVTLVTCHARCRAAEEFEVSCGSTAAPFAALGAGQSFYPQSVGWPEISPDNSPGNFQNPSS